jgi:hypothetical protein
MLKFSGSSYLISDQKLGYIERLQWGGKHILLLATPKTILTLCAKINFVTTSNEKVLVISLKKNPTDSNFSAATHIAQYT